MSAGYISIALGEFSPLIYIGLRQVVSEDCRLRIVGFDLTAYSYGRLVCSYRPSVILLDEMRIQDLSLLKRVRDAYPQVAIVLLASALRHAHHDDCARSRLLGVSYISNGAAPKEIQTAIHLAAEGKRTPSVARLTARESEIMPYLVSGKSYQEIAEQLHIGAETVRTHATRIRRKLGVNKKRDLIGLPLPAHN